MYLNAEQADWVRENGSCDETKNFEEIQKILHGIMYDIYNSALRGLTKVQSYCPDKYSLEIEDKLRELGYEVEYIGGVEIEEIEW